MFGHPCDELATKKKEKKRCVLRASHCQILRELGTIIHEMWDISFYFVEIIQIKHIYILTR